MKEEITMQESTKKTLKIVAVVGGALATCGITLFTILEFTWPHI